MISRIVNFSVARRWHVLIITILLSIVGAFALTRLPIDAVPDITNIQVQINVVVPSLSPADVERQVTYPIETAFAGIPGLESTRSLTRHGFAQVTTVFKGLWCKLRVNRRKAAYSPNGFMQPRQLPRFRTEFAPELPDLVSRTGLCECDV